jgi:hypothetical protein
MKNTHFSYRSVFRHLVVAFAVLGLFAGGAALAAGKTNAACPRSSQAKKCESPTTTNQTTTTTTATTPTTTSTSTTSSTTTTTTTTTTSAPVAKLVTSSISAGAALSGTVSWSVATSGDVSKVEFWANGSLLGTSARAPWAYQLNTVALANGSEPLAVALVSSSGARSSVQIGSVSIDNGPALLSLPVISGTSSVGQALTAALGTWSSGATSYATQWDRCNSTGGSCAPVSGANGQAYTPVAADVGSTLRIAVTASNAYGSAVATSAATAVVSAVAQAPSGSVFWNGDFDTGAFGQYDSIQQFVTGRATIVSSAASLGGPSAPRGGSDFFQCRVVSGDNLYGGERCETLKGNLGIQNGADQWYGWSVAMPANLPANGLTAQFHGTYDYAQADVQFFIDHGQVGAFGSTSAAPRWILGVNGGPAVPGGQYVSNPYSKAFDLGPLANWTGAGWVDVVMHITWADTATGTVELWLKKAGASTYTKYVSQVGNVANLYQGYTAYLKLGLNRTESSGLADGYIWYDNVRGGTTFASVDPSTP